MPTPQTLRSVFAVFVEQMQNVIRYSAEESSGAAAGPDPACLKESRYGVLTIGKEGDDYVVPTGNLIEGPRRRPAHARLSRSGT